VLGRDLKGFHYRAVVGKLNFLGKGSRPEIVYSVHQCARFSESPKYYHVEAVVYIYRYLLLHREQGIILDSQDGTFFEVYYADANFCGNWNRSTTMNDVSTGKSRTGYIIYFAGYPITWASNLQTQIALSTTEVSRVYCFIPVSQGGHSHDQLYDRYQ
jgi:hypothetical protein